MRAIQPAVDGQRARTVQPDPLPGKEILKARTQVVGTLYIQDLLDHLEDRGHVRDLMHQRRKPD